MGQTNEVDEKEKFKQPTACRPDQCEKAERGRISHENIRKLNTLEHNMVAGEDIAISKAQLTGLLSCFSFIVDIKVAEIWAVFNVKF